MATSLDIKEIKKIHFTGIKGVGMTALALCAKDMGARVTGSDTKEVFVTDETLKKVKISWQVGFSSQRIKKIKPDLLIFTAAHEGEKNPEVIGAEKLKIPTLSQANALGFFMKEKIGISVCGVGGKTTTSSMIVHLLERCGFHPSFAIGVGNIFSLGTPGKFNKKSKYFVAEADEYFASPVDKTPKFFYQEPEIIVVTNIEFDHPDVYKNIEETFGAFKNFVKKIPKNGLLVACLDNTNVQKLLKVVNVPTITYGFSPEADWQINKFYQGERRIFFSIKHKNLEWDNLGLKIPGRFNVANATAALIVAFHLGINHKNAQKAIESFAGTKRRFEKIAQVDDVLLYDDYAHHPLEIQVTLKAAKEWFGRKKIIAIFQPHTFSRTKSLMNDFAKSFSHADQVIISKIYASAREKDDLGVSGETLAQKIKESHPDVVYLPEKKQVIEFLKKEIKGEEVIFTLGAGDIFNWHRDIIKGLSN